MTTKLRLFLTTLTLFASGVSNAASVSVSCPGTPIATDREFTITTNNLGATCLASAPGNISGTNDPITSLGYILLDKSDDLFSGLLPQSLTATPPTSGLSGTFSIFAPGYTNFVIALKSGNGVLNPDWAAFLLPNGVTSGSWAVSGDQALSHVNLYGQVSAVPLPAAAWLFGSALGLFGWMRRRG